MFHVLTILASNDISGRKNIDRLISRLFAVSRLIGERSTGEPVAGRSILRNQTLKFVSEKDNPSMGDISARFGVTAPTATSLVNGLVRNGLITRIPDPDDRRIVRLVLTENGKAELDRGCEAFAGRMKEIFGVLNAEEMEDFVAILEKVTARQAE